MKANSFALIVQLLFLIFSVNSFKLDQNSQLVHGMGSQLKNSFIRQNYNLSDCQNPLMYEYISKFIFPANDIDKLLKNQFSNFTLNDGDAPNKVEFRNIVATSKLVSNDQSESYPTPLKVIVTSNQIQFTLKYQINVKKYTRNHKFNAETVVSNISVGYEKQYNITAESYFINSATVKIDPKMMKTKYQSHSPNKTIEDQFTTAINGSGDSLYTNLTKLFSSEIVKGFMQSNTKGIRIAQTYLSSPYNYKYSNDVSNTTVSIDVKTTLIMPKDSSLTNGLAGRFLSGNSFCGDFVPNFTNSGASLFISKSFIQNFVQYAGSQYLGWKNIRIDKDSFRSDLIQWKLLDLDFVVDGLWSDLRQFLYNQIYVVCSFSDQTSTQFNIKQNKIHQEIKWQCEGNVIINESTKQKVLDFMPKINHITEIKILNNAVSLYVNELQTVDCTFNDVTSMNQKGKYTVGQSGAKLAITLMETLFNDFKNQPIGNKFYAGGNIKQVKVEEMGNGIWVI